MGTQIRVVINHARLEEIEQQVKKTAFQTIQDVRVDVDRAQTVPFLTGSLDNSSHNDEAIRENQNGYELHYSAPYAIRRYYEPAEFTTTFHANATDHWLDCYKADGTKNDFIQKKFQEHLNNNINGGGN